MNTSPTFDIGKPVLQPIWVDPVSGDDTNSGDARAQALKTLPEAWRRVPDQPDGRGRHIRLCPGTYTTNVENQILLQDKHGSHAWPIVIGPADLPLSVELPQVSVRRSSSVYMVDLAFAAASNPYTIPSEDLVLHFAGCRDILVRGVTAKGIEINSTRPAITYKANQCHRVYVEDCDFSYGAYNALDYVSVQWGHIVRSRFHDCNAEGMYVKGGSAYLLIANNEVFNSKNIGIQAGQGTGFQYMIPPWLHYEAYDIKIVNNVIYNAGGGLGVQGGYNILAAWNTCYRVGSSRDTIVVGLGGRGWNGPRPKIVDDFFKLGGWCNPSSGEGYNIPNRNVLICNNVICNPDGYESRHAHIGLSGPVATLPDSNLPNPARADDGLEIRGNVIWNGGADKPVLDDVENMYHLAARPTADAAELCRLNAINTLRPEFIDPEQGDFRPVPGGKLSGFAPVALKDFEWSDAPARPEVPPGNLDNQVVADRMGKSREKGNCVGAHVAENAAR